MRIVIVGGHGQIALRLERQLAGRSHESVGIIRNPDHAEDLRSAGAEPVVLDLESASVDEAAAVLEGADAVVFAAGGGGDGNRKRKETVDFGGVVLFGEAAERAGVRRFVLVSSLGADAHHEGEEVFDVYLRAKGRSEEDLKARSGLDWTILRPGALKNEPATGLVHLSPQTGRGPVPRDDVAAVLVALLETPGTAGLTLGLITGTVPVADAVEAAATGA